MDDQYLKSLRNSQQSQSLSEYQLTQFKLPKGNSFSGRWKSRLAELDFTNLSDVGVYGINVSNTQMPRRGIQAMNSCPIAQPQTDKSDFQKTNSLPDMPAQRMPHTPPRTRPVYLTNKQMEKLESGTESGGSSNEGFYNVDGDDYERYNYNIFYYAHRYLILSERDNSIFSI